MRAWNLTRGESHYRHEMFNDGLRAVGYEVLKGSPREVVAGDVLLIWNRYGPYHEIATAFEAAGGTVIVAENGYLGRDGISPHAMDPRQIYALAIGGHNGQGSWPSGGPERFAALGVDLRPWRADGGHVLVCPNRSFGIPGRMMPPTWVSSVHRRLVRLTKREIRIRPHPGNEPAKKPLAEDLRDAWAVVIWSSSAGLYALLEGIPVVCEAPYWILKGATCPDWEARVRGGVYPRRRHFERMAWAQWSIDEISRGEPFRLLLDR